LRWTATTHRRRGWDKPFCARYTPWVTQFFAAFRRSCFLQLVQLSRFDASDSVLRLARDNVRGSCRMHRREVHVRRAKHGRKRAPHRQRDRRHVASQSRGRHRQLRGLARRRRGRPRPKRRHVQQRRRGTSRLAQRRHLEQRRSQLHRRRRRFGQRLSERLHHFPHAARARSGARLPVRRRLRHRLAHHYRRGRRLGLLTLLGLRHRQLRHVRSAAVRSRRLLADAPHRQR